MNPQTLTMVLQLAQFGIETAREWSDGEITDAELERRWADMAAEVQDANELWIRAGKG